MSSPSSEPALSPATVEHIMDSSVKMVKKLMDYAEKNPIISTKDVREVKGAIELGLKVVDKATTDPFFMAHMVKNMPKDRINTLNEWIHQTRRMGK